MPEYEFIMTLHLEADNWDEAWVRAHAFEKIRDRFGLGVDEPLGDLDIPGLSWLNVGFGRWTDALIEAARSEMVYPQGVEIIGGDVVETVLPKAMREKVTQDWADKKQSS